MLVTRKPPLQHSPKKTFLRMDSMDSGSEESLSRSSHSPEQDPEEDWIVIDPRADRDFINNVRKKILECVKTKNAEPEPILSEETETRNEMEFETEPSRSSIIDYIEQCSLFKDEYHTRALIGQIREYINNVKKKTILDIVDQQEDVEDAIFLISEVLYGNKHL